MQFFPPFSKTADEKASLRIIRVRELRVYRRYPSFILGFVLLLGSWVATIYFLGWSLVSGLIILAGVVGFALIHDTITLHLLRVIQRREEPDRERRPHDLQKI